MLLRSYHYLLQEELFSCLSGPRSRVVVLHKEVLEILTVQKKLSCHSSLGECRVTHWSGEAIVSS